MNKYRIIAFLALIALICFHACARADNTTTGTTDNGTKAASAEEAYQEGRRLFFTEQYKEAAESFREAAELDPEKTVYRLFLAKALRNSGEEKQAEEILLAILEKHPDYVEAGIAIAEIYEKGGKWKDLVNVLVPILKYRHDYTVYHMLANAYYNLANLKQACVHYEKAVELNPQAAEDFYELGNIYLGESRYAMAAEAYERCLDLNYSSAYLHYKLASAYSNLRNYLGAISVRVIANGKVDTISDNCYLIDTVPGQKDTFYVAPTNSAIYQANKAIALGIDELDIRFLCANIWLGAGYWQKAHTRYAALEDKYADGKIDKSDRALFYHQFAEAAFGLELFDDFLRHTAKTIELEPDTYKPLLVNAYLRVAECKQRNGDMAAYIEYIRKALAEQPDTASLHLMLANACRDTQNFADAVKHWRMVLEIEPDRPDRTELLNLVREYEIRGE